MKYRYTIYTIFGDWVKLNELPTYDDWWLPFFSNQDTSITGRLRINLQEIDRFDNEFRNKPCVRAIKWVKTPVISWVCKVSPVRTGCKNSPVFTSK